MEIIENNTPIEMQEKFSISEEGKKQNTIKQTPPILVIFGVIFTIAALSAIGFFVYDKFFSSKESGMESPVAGEPKNNAAKNQNMGVKEMPSPINGVLYTKEQYESFKDRRPLAIMVNNHIDARPQHGLSKADIVFEAVAEGGITRLMPIYHAQDAPKVGPVRSSRVHYIDLAAEFHAWYAHWGGAYAPTLPNGEKNYAETNPKADSYQHINDIGIASLDQMWLGETAYYRDTSKGVALEHTGYTDTVALWAEGPNRYPEEGWTKFIKFDVWKFKDDAAPSDRGYVTDIKFNFWDDPNFEVIWTYDKNSNSYLRSQGGVKVVDAEDNTQITAKNVIVQFTTETSANDKKNHLLYDIVGSGTAKIFRDGKVINATWVKDNIRSRTKYFSENGAGVEFNRGQIWVEIVPSRNVDSLSFTAQ